MLAKDNDYIKDAASTVYQLSQDEMIRLQCEAREDYYRTQIGLKYEMEKRDAQIETLSTENQNLSAKTKNLSVENQNLSAENQNLSVQIQDLSSEKEKLLAWALEHGYQPD